MTIFKSFKIFWRFPKIFEISQLLSIICKALVLKCFSRFSKNCQKFFLRMCIIFWRRILGFFKIFEDLHNFTLGFQRFCKYFLRLPRFFFGILKISIGSFENVYEISRVICPLSRTFSQFGSGNICPFIFLANSY